MECNNLSTPQKTLIQEEMCLYQELLDCLEEESRALMTAQEEAILAATAKKEALLERLLEVKRIYENSPQATAAGQGGELLAHLRRQVVAANAWNRDIMVTSLEVVQEFLAQFQPPGPGLYEPAGPVKSGQANALFQRQV
jgi:flagellar biosynthesis/type III secretory pathway chaperone